MTTETVTVPMSFWDKLTARLFPEPPAQPEPEPEPVKPTEPDQMSAIVAERDTYKAELDALKAEQAKTTRLEQFTAQLKETKSPEGAEMLAGMTDEQAAWVIERFKALSAQINETAIVGELGTSAQGDLTEDPKARLDNAVKAIMAEKKVDYAAAIAQVPADLVAAAYPIKK